MVLPYSNTDYGEDQVGATNIQELTDVELTNLANGEVLKYNLTSDKWENFAPTYLDGTGISDNFLIKIVSGAATQTSFIETSVLNTSTSLKTYIPLTPPLSLLAGSIETELFDSTKKRMHLTTSGIATSNGITITSDGRVGIGVVNPEEDFEIDGNIQLDTGGAERGRLIFYDKQNDHEHAEVDGLGEGTNGGALVFYTKVDGGLVTEKIRINNVGAIGIAGANFGTTNQVLISNGSNSSVEWTDSVTFADATVTGTVVTPEVASTTSTIDVGSGVNRRIRIEDKSTTNFGELEMKPIRTAAGISSNVEPINSYIQFFAQNGASDMTLFSEDLIQIRTNNNSYIRVTPTEATCTSPFTAPTLTASDSLIYGGDTQSSPPIGLHIKNQLENNTTDFMRLAPSNTGTLRINPDLNHIKFRTFGSQNSKDLLIRGEDRTYLIGGSAVFNDAARITLQQVSGAARVDIAGEVVTDSPLTATTLKASDSLIQIDSASVARLKFQQSGQSPHALGEIDSEQDGTDGGDLQFYTKVDGGSVTEKLRINNVGAIGIAGANFGTAGQVLTSNGSGSAVSWGLSLNSKVYASATLTADITGVTTGSTIIGASTGLTDQLSSSTAGVIQSGVTYSGFKAPRDGIYNISIASYVIANIGGVEAHTQLRNVASTSTTTILKNAFYTSGTSAYSLTNSVVLKMAQNEVVYIEIFGPNPFTVRGDSNGIIETRISFFNVD